LLLVDVVIRYLHCVGTGAISIYVDNNGIEFISSVKSYEDGYVVLSCAINIQIMQISLSCLLIKT
jgi:hypothetical protein